MPEFIHRPILRNNSSSASDRYLFNYVPEWWNMRLGYVPVYLTVRGSILSIRWGGEKVRRKKRKNVLGSIGNPCNTRNPCFNSGTCFGRYNADGTLSTQCFCLERYTGDLCESENEAALFDCTNFSCGPFQQIFVHRRPATVASVLQLKTPSSVLVQRGKLAIVVK